MSTETQVSIANVSELEDYSIEDIELADQMGMSVDDMIELFHQWSENEGLPIDDTPEYSPEWPTDFIGDGFHANNFRHVYNIAEMRADNDTPLHMPPKYAAADISMQLDFEHEYDSSDTELDKS